MLETGTRLGDYEILDIESMSRKEVVYRVRNTVAQRLESLKVLPESLQQDAESLERFSARSRCTPGCCTRISSSFIMPPKSTGCWS